MAKKKPAANSKPDKAKPKSDKVKPKKDETVELHIPQEVYNFCKATFPTSREWNDQIRLLFHIIDEDVETCRGMKYCKIKVKGKPTVKNAAADDDSDDEPCKDPIKLCDEGGR